MCLTRIDHCFQSVEEMEGWKVFQKSRGKLYSFIFALNGKKAWIYGSEPVPLDCLLESVRKEISEEMENGKTTEPYMSGFHFCQTKEDAVNLMEALGWYLGDKIAVKAKFRNVRLKGTQECEGAEFPVYVADQMFIPIQSNCDA